MAYGAKYQWQGTRAEDSVVYTAELLFDGYGGSVNTIAALSIDGPWRHEVGERGDDVDTALSEHEVKLYIIAPNGSYLSEIEDAADTEILLRIKAGSDITFLGMVEPSLGERVDSDSNNVIIVTARSGLKWLDNIPYPNVDDGRVSLFEHARNCLGELPFDLPFNTIDRYFTINLTGDPFDGHFADGIVLKDNNGDARSCRYVLEQVVGRKFMNLRQSEGTWQFQQVDALFESTTERNEYTSAGVLDNTDSSYDGSVEYDRDVFRSPEPTVYKRTALGQIDINYNHRKFGDALFDNGDFNEIDGVTKWAVLTSYDLGNKVIHGGDIYTADSDHISSTDSEPGVGSDWETFWTLTTSSDDVQPADWTSSDEDHTRLFREQLEIDVYFQSTTLIPGNVDSVGVWNIEQAGESVTLNETAPGTLVFDANWQDAGVQPSTTTRPLPWTFKVGTKWWDDDNQSWSASKVVNVARVSYASERFEFPMSAWPETGVCTLRFYALVDDEAVLTGANDPADPDQWDTDLAGTVRIDNVNVEISDESGVEASSRVFSVFLESRSNRKTREYKFDFGQGPTSSHLSRLTLSGGGDAVSWQYEDDFTGGSSGIAIDRFHGSRAMSMLRKPREAKRWSFKYLTGDAKAHETILEDSVRYWPVYYSSRPYLGLFGGEYVRIRRDGDTGVDMLAQLKRQTRTSIEKIGGNRTQVFQGFDDQIALRAPKILLDTDVLQDEDWDGTLSGGSITGFASVASWAITGEGHFEFTDGSEYIRFNGSGINIRGDITITGGSGIASLTDAGALATGDDLDDVPDGSTYAKTLASALSAGQVLLDQASGDLDDISDGGTYEKVLATSISAGKIILAETDGDLDDVDDGSTYNKVLATSISAGKIILAQTDGDLDDVDDGTTYAKVKSTILAAGFIQVGSGTKDSTLSGFHIDSGEIVGQASGVDQVVMNTSGQIVAGAGNVTMDADGITIDAGTGTGNKITFKDGSLEASIFYHPTSNWIEIFSDENIYLSTSSSIIFNSTSILNAFGNPVWHDGNHGSGSGLDADLLDGSHASAFVTAVTAGEGISGGGSGGSLSIALDISELTSTVSSSDFGAGTFPFITAGGNQRKINPGNIKLDVFNAVIDGKLSLTGATGPDIEYSGTGALNIRNATASQDVRISAVSGEVQLSGNNETDNPIRVGNGNILGFFGTAPQSKPTVSGSRGGNAALADLLTELATLGLITDNSSA